MKDVFHTVYIVVDPLFGERLASLPPGKPVWIVDTPINKPVAKRLWGERPKASHLMGITTYKAVDGVSAEANLIKELDTIDLHHEIQSADHRTRIEVFGTPLTETVKRSLAEYGFDQFSPTPDGFVASRRVNASTS